MANIVIDKDKCVVCGLCIEVCDSYVLDTDGNDAYVEAIHPENCTQCMLCEDECYENAIKVFI